MADDPKKIRLQAVLTYSVIGASWMIIIYIILQILNTCS